MTTAAVGPTAHSLCLQREREPVSVSPLPFEGVMPSVQYWLFAWSPSLCPFCASEPQGPPPPMA